MCTGGCKVLQEREERDKSAALSYTKTQLIRAKACVLFGTAHDVLILLRDFPSVSLHAFFCHHGPYSPPSLYVSWL